MLCHCRHRRLCVHNNPNQQFCTSKLHTVFYKECFASRMAGCEHYWHHRRCSYWQSLMAISFVWISKRVIYLQSNIHSEYVQSSCRNMSTCSWWHRGPYGTNFTYHMGLFLAKRFKKMGVYHIDRWPAGPLHHYNEALNRKNSEGNH